MKIIIGTESFNPNISGVAVHAELLAKDMASKGHEVHVFCPSKNFSNYKDENFPDFEVHRLKSVPNPFRQGYRIAILPRKTIKSLVAVIEPDIIHVQDPTSISSALLKISKENNIPIFITNHFNLDYVTSYLGWLKPFHGKIKRILTIYLRNFYNKCVMVFCPTETVRGELIKWGVKTPIMAISNGVDLERFFSYSSPSVIRLKYHLPLNPIVLYVGRINKDKDLETLIGAIPFVAQKVDAHFLFVGSGDDLPKLKKLVSKLGVSRRVTFLGSIKYESEDLPQIYQISSVFVMPSQIETQSIVTLEAMASGLPVVAADSGALPELVKNGENGYLFEPGNKIKLSEKIVEILTNDTLAKRMSGEALIAVSKHQVDNCLLEIEENYKKVVDKHDRKS